MFEIANYLLRILAYKFIWPWRLSYAISLKKIASLAFPSSSLRFPKAKNWRFDDIYIYRNSES